MHTSAFDETSFADLFLHGISVFYNLISNSVAFHRLYAAAWKPSHGSWRTSRGVKCLHATTIRTCWSWWRSEFRYYSLSIANANRVY